MCGKRIDCDIENEMREQQQHKEEKNLKCKEKP